MSELRIAVPGAAGRMGLLLLREIIAAEGCVLSGAGERPGHTALGKDAGTLAGSEHCGVALSEDPATLLAGADAIIDFTAPCGAADYAPKAAEIGAAYIIGATALEAEAQAAVDAASKQVAVVQAANMSLGINLLAALVEQCASRLDNRFDIEIMELHHAAKADAPSGTALTLAEAAAQGRGVDPAEAALPPRSGRTGPRPTGGIGFAAARGGDAVGDHSVLFCGPGERLELTHRAGDRRIYAAGALQAARWAVRQPPGKYDMRAVLGL